MVNRDTIKHQIFKLKPYKIVFILLLLPVTLFLDLILYAMVKTCPSCGSFWQFVETEGALSFPVIISIGQWFRQKIGSERANKNVTL